MILFIEEVDLVLQLLHVSLVGLLLVLLGELVHVLAALVELAEAQYFLVTLFNLLTQPLHFFLLFKVLLHKLIVLMSQLIGPFVCPAKLSRPLLVFDCHSAAPILVLIPSCGPLRLLHTFIALPVVKASISTCTLSRQILAELKALGRTTEHIVQFAVGVQPANNLVLRGHVQLLHHPVQFLAQFHIFSIKVPNLAVFLREQEFEVLHLVLGLAALRFPFEVGTVRMLAILDQLEVKVVVFFDDSLIFVLEWRHGLTIELCFVGDDGVFIFQFLERFCSLKHLVEEPFDQCRRFNVYRYMGSKVSQLFTQVKTFQNFRQYSNTKLIIFILILRDFA